MTEMGNSRRWLWPAVIAAVVLMVGAGWIWVSRPTELERLADRIKVGMTRGEVEALFNSHGEGQSQLRFHGFWCYVLAWGANGDEVVVTFDTGNNKVESAEYRPDPDRSSRPIRWWKRVRPW